MKKRTLVVLLLVFHTSLFSQSPASIEELIPKLQSANDSEKIDLYGHISFLYMSRDRFDSAIYYMNLSLPISQKLGDPKKIGNAYNNLGTIYRMSGENERAMENLVKALTIFEKNNFNKQSSKALGNISYIYTQQQNYNEAVKTLLQAAQKSEAANDTLTLIDLHSTIAQNYQYLKNLPEARNYIQKGETLINTLRRRRFAEPMDSVKFNYAVSSLKKVSAGIYTDAGDFNAAIRMLKEELDDSKTYNIAGINKIEIYTGLGDNYFQTGRYDSALAYTDRALELLREDSIPDAYKNIYSLRAKIFSGMNRFREAYEAYVLFKNVSDSINSEKITKSISEIQAKYETEKKNQQIADLHKEKKTQRMIIGLSVGALVITLGLFLLALRSRKLQQKLFRQKEELIIKEKEIEKNALEQRMTELEQMALRAQMNPHFIFNSLNSVQHFMMNNDAEGVNKFLGTFAHLVRQTLNNSGKPLIPLDEEIRYLDTYLSLERMKSNNQFEYSISVQNDIDTSGIFIPGMILQPFVENSIRHGVAHKENKDGLIRIAISRNGRLICQIDDNGVGRQKASEIKTNTADTGYRSQGMEITMHRIEAINKLYNSSISVQFTDRTDDRDNATGTIVKIELPTNLE